MLNHNKPHPGILIHRIPVDGFPGLIFAAVVLLTLLVGVPALREFSLIVLAGGIVVAGILYYWRNQTRW